jgi:hypothetical protein
MYSEINNIRKKIDVFFPSLFKEKEFYKYSFTKFGIYDPVNIEHTKFISVRLTLNQGLLGDIDDPNSLDIKALYNDDPEFFIREAPVGYRLETGEAVGISSRYIGSTSFSFIDDENTFFEMLLKAKELYDHHFNLSAEEIKKNIINNAL